MATFLAVLSFPFWFFGIAFVLAALTGGVTVNKRRGTGGAHFFAFVIGVVLLVIAWMMV